MVFSVIGKIFLISSLLISLGGFLSGFITYWRDRRSVLNGEFLLVGCASGIWGLCLFLACTVASPVWALSFFRWHYFFYVIFLLMVFRLSLLLLGVYRKYALIRRMIYSVGFSLAVMSWSPWIIRGISPALLFSDWPSPGILHPAVFVFQLILFGDVGILCLRLMRRCEELRRHQLQIVLGSVMLLFLGGFFHAGYYSDFLFLLIGICLMPFGILGLAWAVVRYRFFDVTLVVTRASILFFVYVLVFGIPFSLGFFLMGAGFWILPTTLTAVFSMAGPFLYLYFQRKAEGTLLKDRYHYQETLRNASLGMGRIKDLHRLLNLTVHVVTRAVRVDHCSVYLLHEESHKFVLKASKRGRPIGDFLNEIPCESTFAQYVAETKEPVAYEDVYQKSLVSDDHRLGLIMRAMQRLQAAVVVPSFIEDRLIALIVLGRKRDGKIFTRDDLVVFSILANQSALAIENAQFYEKSQRTQEQLFRAEKMATIGTMADGLSHQMNNRLHAMGFIAGDALDAVRLKKKEPQGEEMKKFLEDMEFSLQRLEENVRRGGEIAEGLLKYTRKGSDGFEAIEFDRLFKETLEMLQYKIKLHRIKVSKRIEPDLPKILGNFTQLQEVFFNIIDNSYDAMMERREMLVEPQYQPMLDVEVFSIKKQVHIYIRDNGIGVKPENMSKLFAPFFTTKLSSKKGTGLGLYVIRRIIEENHKGTVRFRSQYQSGSETEIVLPAV